MMIRLSALRHRYQGRPVLDLAEWHAASGETWLLAGPSGSGKTTLLHIVGGLLRPSEGKVEIAGRDLAELTGAALDRYRGQKIGMVFQGIHLLAPLGVIDNLLLAGTMAGLAPDRARAQELLGALGLADFGEAKPATLSHGQAQRVALARALMNRPALLLADEPTANLDDGQAAAVVDLLFEQATRHGATLIVASHDGRIRERFARRLDLPGRPS